jgi:hypothetical protein
MTIDTIRYRLALAVCLCSWLYAHPAPGCRYNVRETGFVDLGIEQYNFYGYIRNDTPAELICGFEQTLSAAFEDSNIRGEIINVEQEKEHPALKYLESLQIKSFPAAVLVSPDGQSLIVQGGEPNRPFKDTVSSAMDDILSSPAREEILQQVIECYGVVLLIEGVSNNAQENERAKAAVLAAIRMIEAQMDMLPKPIARPPVMVVADSRSLAREKILLWSLGLDARDVTAPHVAIIYGRARWIGPLFKGEQITEANLTAVLFVIGEDCECGIDHRWVQGTMLPVKWDRKLQAKTAANLGFDPESPIIKTEIGLIVGRSIGGSSYPGVPVASGEVGTEAESDANHEVMPKQLKDVTMSGSGDNSRDANSPRDEGIYRPLRTMALVTIGLTAVVVIIGVAVLLRSS